MKSALCLTALMWGATALAQGVPVQDWSLASVLERVSEANRDVLSARRAVDAARADEQMASVTPPAQFSLLSQAIDTQHLGSGSLWHRPVDTIARIDKTLERGGKASLRERAANVALAAARHDEADVLRAQRLTAAQAYWDLKLAQAQLDISARNLHLAQQSSQAAQLRLSQGDLSRLDATRLAVEADKAANEHAQARIQLMQARTNLAQALACVGTMLPYAIDEWPNVPALPDGDTHDDAWLQGRPDVLAAQRRLEQAQAALALTQSQRTTDVTVSVQFEHNPTVANRLWGVGVAFPLGVDGRQDGPVIRALIAVDDAQAQLDKVRTAALADHALQREVLSSALERVHRLEGQLLPQAKEALKGAEFARQQGALSLQDVLDARRALHASELDAAAAHADAAKAWVALTVTSDLNAVTP
jgi:cobalt-zinc-cadmium efflux system outer membrane protein